MGVSTTESVDVPAGATRVFPIVATLDRYPEWLGMVHTVATAPAAVDADASTDVPAWIVELRAQVGPFARSKQLRMERTVHEPDRLVVFERREVDGRRHAAWMLRVELEAIEPSTTRVTMHLSYDGALWTGGLLDRVLDEEIRQGRRGLSALVAE